MVGGLDTSEKAAAEIFGEAVVGENVSGVPTVGTDGTDEEGESLFGALVTAKAVVGADDAADDTIGAGSTDAASVGTVVAEAAVALVKVPGEAVVGEEDGRVLSSSIATAGETVAGEAVEGATRMGAELVLDTVVGVAVLGRSVVGLVVAGNGVAAADVTRGATVGEDDTGRPVAVITGEGVVGVPVTEPEKGGAKLSFDPDVGIVPIGKSVADEMP